MITEDQLKVGAFYTFPFPGGHGTTRTQVKEVFGKGDNRTVRHESRGARHGAIVTIHTFLRLASIEV